MNFTSCILTALLSVVAFSLPAFAAGSQECQKPVIALIAFGTSIPEAQKSFEEIDSAFSKAFPKYEIHWAFTAQFIIDKLAKEGQTTMFKRQEQIVNPEQLFKNLADKGVKEVYVQSLHVVPGGEYNELTADKNFGLDLKFSSPLLGNAADIATVAKIISKEFGTAEQYTIVAGHGNDHHISHNDQLVKFNDYLKANYKNVQLATVEGPVGTEAAFAAVKASGLKEVKFIPFMIVAGDHIQNDVMGDEPDSWKSILGLKATVVPPLGQNPEIIQVFIDHLKATISQ